VQEYVHLILAKGERTLNKRSEERLLGCDIKDCVCERKPVVVTLSTADVENSDRENNVSWLETRVDVQLHESSCFNLIKDSVVPPTVAKRDNAYSFNAWKCYFSLYAERIGLPHFLLFPLDSIHRLQSERVVEYGQSCCVSTTKL